MNKIEEIKSKIKVLKNELKNEVLYEAERIDYPDALKLIVSNEIFPIANSMRSPFDSFIEKFSKTTRSQCIDDIFLQSRERYQIITWIDYIEHIEYEKADNDGKIVILTSRCDKEFKLTKDEALEAIYDYCIEKKLCGFELDW